MQSAEILLLYSFFSFFLLVLTRDYELTNISTQFTQSTIGIACPVSSDNYNNVICT